MLILHTNRSGVCGDVDNIGEGPSALLDSLRDARVRNVNRGIVAEGKAKCIVAVDILKLERSVNQGSRGSSRKRKSETYRNGGFGDVAIIKYDANRTWKKPVFTTVFHLALRMAP